MTNTEVCVLEDGRRVKYRVDWRKPRSQYMYAYFRGPDGRRREVSTFETNAKRAKDTAVALIAKEYRPQAFSQAVSWEDSIARMVKAMEANNLRPNTITTYQTALQSFRKAFPSLKGPASVTPLVAEQYKEVRMVTESPYTVRGDLNELRVIFGKWFGKQLKLLDSNPFAEIELPTVDKLEPRVIREDERATFESWLSTKWGGWRMPLLFLEVKASIGCRIRELAETPTRNLADGRITFDADTAKGRKTRRSKLPATLFAELRSIAGPKYVWERFPDELQALLLKREKPHHAKSVKFPYDPYRLVAWLQDRLVEFRDDHPEVPWFKLHNYRGTAMSHAREAGVDYARAAIAFGCNVETMRRHYVRLDETEISDSVMDALHATTKKME